MILFCNFWNERKEVEELLGDYEYITAFPTAGGNMQKDGKLNCVLFDHIMLESRDKAKIRNYDELIALLARELMADSRALSMAVKCIRETLKTVSARGVDLRRYNNEIFPYKIPSRIAGIAMKKLFAGNELTAGIMTLHNDVKDIMYGCRSVYDEGKKHGLELPLFYGNMDRIFAGMEG